MEKIIQPAVCLLGVLVVKDERTGGKIPLEDLVLVMTSRAVPVQINARGGWVFPEAVVAVATLRGNTIAMRVVDQEQAPIGNRLKVTDREVDYLFFQTSLSYACHLPDDVAASVDACYSH